MNIPGIAPIDRKYNVSPTDLTPMAGKRKITGTGPGPTPSEKKIVSCQESSLSQAPDCSYCDYHADSTRLYCNGICVGISNEYNIYLCNIWKTRPTSEEITSDEQGQTIEDKLFFCGQHNSQTKQTILNVDIRKTDDRVIYKRGEQQLVVATETEIVQAKPRRRLVPFEFDMPHDVMRNLPLNSSDLRKLTMVSKEFSEVYTQQQRSLYQENPDQLKSDLKMAVKKNNLTFINTVIPLLPEGEVGYLAKDLHYIQGTC